MQSQVLPLTKIIATVGPASADPEVLGRLIESGVSIVRLNFSHGTPETHATVLGRVREVAAARDRPTAVLGDLPGPKIRVGPVEGGPVTVQPGMVVRFRRAGLDLEADGPVFTCTYEALIDDVEPGQRLLVNDGAVRMLVVSRTDAELLCTVVHGGPISTGKGINLPDTTLSVRTITERDWSYVDWALEHDLDFLGLSFTRSAADVVELREGIRERAVARGLTGFEIPLVAKIEVREAVDAADAIIAAADGVMIARGDLGVEMDLAEVPVIQKRLRAVAHAHGKPCIVATQMLESMVHAPTPTRAEASDVAGAIFDQVDAVMLSGETAIGAFPVLAVDAMRRIAVHTETWIASQPQGATPPVKLRQARHREAAIAHGVWTVRQDVSARCIVVWSQSGRTAVYLSQNNFHVPIIAMTSDTRAARQMQLLRSVVPVHTTVPPDVDALKSFADDFLLTSGFADVGDVFVLVSGEPLGASGVTSTISLEVVDVV
jgi:pyruvate kinase